MSLPARVEAPLKELAPLGNGWFFSLFLLTGLITVVACAVVYPLADRFVDDPGDAIRKMRVAGWARLLAFLLLFPFFSWVMFLTRADQASSCSSVRALGISLAITPLILITAYLLMEAFQSMGRSFGRGCYQRWLCLVSKDRFHFLRCIGFCCRSFFRLA